MDPAEYWLHEFKHQSAEGLHRSEVSNALGQGALKSMMLVNGGAVLSLLTFVGNDGTVRDPHLLKWGMGFFGAGLFCVLFSYFFAYFAQGDFMNAAYYKAVDAQVKMGGKAGIEVPELHQSRGTRLLWIAVGLLLLSLIMFAAGSMTSLNSIL